jgi:RND family efflux transporter MFP subunit
MQPRFFFAAISMVLLAGLVGLAGAQAQFGGPTQVVTDAVRVEPLTETAPVIGRLVARDTSAVASRVSGPVVDVFVDVGDRVEVGDPLVQLDRNRLEAELELAEAEIREIAARAEAALASQALAQQELQRIEQLRGSAAFSQARFEDANQELLRASALAAEADARLHRAEVSVELTRLDLEYATVRAPFPGVVIDRSVGVGEYVGAGAEIATVLNDQDLEIEIPVSAERAAALEPGAVVDFALSELDRSADAERLHQAIVRATIPVEDPMTRTRRVRLTPAFTGEVDNLAAGQTVTVLVPVGEERDVVTVHKDAVLIDLSGPNVFVIVDGQAQPRQVEIGAAVGERFEVLSGLEPGDQVVVRGNERLRPGQQVVVQNGEGGAPGEGPPGGPDMPNEAPADGGPPTAPDSDGDGAAAPEG